MSTMKVCVIGAALIVLGGIGWFAISQSENGDSMMQGDKMMEKDAEAAMKKDGDAMVQVEGEAMVKEESGAMMEKKGDAMTQ